MCVYTFVYVHVSMHVNAIDTPCSCLPTEKSNNLPFTAESSSAVEGDCARLLYCTSADIEQRTGEAQDPGMNISAGYVVHNNKKAWCRQH